MCFVGVKFNSKPSVNLVSTSEIIALLIMNLGDIKYDNALYLHPLLELERVCSTGV